MEVKFQHRVDIAVPAGGLGNRLTEMLMWCRTSVPAGAWDQRGHKRANPQARRSGGLGSLLLR